MAIPGLQFQLQAGPLGPFQQGLKGATGVVNVELGKMNRAGTNFSTKFKNSMGSAASGLTGRAGLAGAILAVSAAMVSLGRSMVTNGDMIRQLQGRFTALTGSSERAAESIDSIFQIALEVGAPVESVAQAFTRYTIAAENLGASEQQVSDFVETVLKLGTIGGASTQELSAGAIQLGQALASGRLQGDELRSILENIPLVSEAIADGLGVSSDALREMGADGRLVSEDVFRVILEQVEDVRDTFEELPLTVERAGGQLAAAWSLFSAELDKSIGLSETLASVLGSVAGFIASIGQGLADRQFVNNVEELQKVQEELAARAQGETLPARAIGRRQSNRMTTEELQAEEMRLFGLIQDDSQVNVPLAQPGASSVSQPAARRGGGGGGSRTRRESTAFDDAFGASMLNQQALLDEIAMVGMAKDARAEYEAVIASGALQLKLLTAAEEQYGAVSEEVRAEIMALSEAEKGLRIELFDKEEALRAVEEAMKAQAEAAEKAKSDAEEFGDALGDIGSRAESASDALRQMVTLLASTALKGFLTGDGVFGGLNSAAGFSGNVFDSLFGNPAPNANGNAFGGQGVIPFAAGGVVSSPTPFTFGRNNLGVMGEAGPEAIIPLSRGKDGKLGISASAANVSVNIINNAGASVTTSSRDTPGGPEIDVLIDQVVASKLNDPGSATSRILNAGRR